MKSIAVVIGLGLLCAAPLSAAPVSAFAQDNPPTVTVDAGRLTGVRTGGLDVYKGIPYAAPPVGDLRWEPPAPAAHWSGVRDATTFGASCAQPPRPDNVVAAGADQKQSEDCLFLNVWTFDGAKKAPVMVWIHGGAFRFGSAAGAFYNGADFARDGVILVSINYRLGALGFFAHPALTKAAAPDAPLGDYGIMDQIAALQWVKRNIKAFGGDPDNVTVFGESAGGSSVLTLLSTPSAKGLFAKAIVESGGGWSAKRSLADAEKSGLAQMAALGLGADATPAQLRALPAEKLLKTPMTLGGAGPFQDGRLIRETVIQAFANGDAIRTPLIIGSNSGESTLMKAFSMPSSAMTSRMPPAVRALYPANDDQAAAAIFTDAIMGAPAQWVASKAAEAAPTFLYHFSYVPTARRASQPGTPHGGEIPFVFGAWPAAFDQFASPEDHAVEALVHACWVAFAKSGAPACGDKAWPAFNPARDQLMEFGESSGPVANFRTEQYQALQRVLLPAMLGR